MNYMGLWKKSHQPLSKMTKKEVVTELKTFRNAWTNITGRDQDLSDGRLKTENLKELKDHLKWYFSEDARKIAEQWIGNKIQLYKSHNRGARARKSTRKSRAHKSARKSRARKSTRKSARKSRARKSTRKSARKSRARKSTRKSTRKSRARKSTRKSTHKSARKSRAHRPIRISKLVPKLSNAGKKFTRPSPSYSATSFNIGSIQTGNDGNLWYVSEAMNGVKKWKKVVD
jgi:hypothetical protein